MGDALRATGRPIVYSLCNWGEDEPWTFGPLVGGSAWRTTGDIVDSWGSVLNLLDLQVGLEPFARNNGFNDPDMLEVGNGGMTHNEYVAHFSLWSLLNRSGATATISTSAAELGLGGSSSYSLRNLWTGATSSTNGAISASVPSHGVVMYRVFRAGSLLGPAPSAGTHQVADLAWLASSNGWGPVERNRSNGETSADDGRTLTINGSTYAKGLGAHSDSAVHVYLGRACPLFSSDVGIDDEVTKSAASVTFSVIGDGSALYTSPVVITPTGPALVSSAEGTEPWLVQPTALAKLQMPLSAGRAATGRTHARPPSAGSRDQAMGRDTQRGCRRRTAASRSRSSAPPRGRAGRGFPPRPPARPAECRRSRTGARTCCGQQDHR